MVGEKHEEKKKNGEKEEEEEEEEKKRQHTNIVAKLGKKKWSQISRSHNSSWTVKVV